MTGGIHVRALILACVLSFGLGAGLSAFVILRTSGQSAERAIYAAQLATTAARHAMESTLSGLGSIRADNQRLVALNDASGAELKRVNAVLAEQRAINAARRANDERVKQQLFDLGQSTAASLTSAHDAEQLYRIIYDICDQLYTIYHGHPREPGPSPGGGEAPGG